ncbi:ubiquitin carboxyl-terminal hydrolase 37-like [Scomber scombrus]|uniref:Ubiquitin carboxyl-terminal hydrolase 37-like n=1 Tax=Scomber scombrus TaxID=13677 RepID=A0AAV1N6V2_SCOSC
MLQLKSFKYSPSMRLEKLHYPVELFRELMVTSKQVSKSRLLMLQLKSFQYCPSLRLEKLHYPVELFRELMVTSRQSLITLKGFVNNLIVQVEVWSAISEAQLIRGFINIIMLHRSTVVNSKFQAFSMFKSLISIMNPEFKD